MKHIKMETTPETSRRMSNVRLKGGITESRIAKGLWHIGIRYRKNWRALPGSPDIAITRYHVAVFIDGEFWHGYDWTDRKERLHRNRDYWIEKIEENIRRDREVDRKLKAQGWIVIRYWERYAKTHIGDCIAEIARICLMGVSEQ